MKVIRANIVIINWITFTWPENKGTFDFDEKNIKVILFNCNVSYIPYRTDEFN